MAACDMITSSSSSYGLHQASLIHILPSADRSPTTVLSNGTMGSTSSLLADSGYRGYSDTTTNSNSSVFEEPSVPNDDTESIGPPKLTPISGKLEKTKEKKLIKPIAVRFASPNTSPTETTYNKHSSSQSPSLSDTMATYAHPPDILMTNNHNHNHGFSAGKHFGKPPTKTMSLQDITPVQQPYRMNGHHGNHGSNGHNGHHQSTLPHKGDAAQRSALHQKLQQAQSLNFLNRGGWANIHHGGTVPGKIGNSRHRSHSQSMYPGDGHRPIQASHGQDTRQQHSYPNLTSPRTNGEEHVYAPVSVSSVPEESDLAEENRILRNKVQNKHDQDMKHQLVTMRNTMEVNEQTIFQVQDEKRRDYEGRLTRLQNQLQQEKESSHSQQRSQQQEIYRIEQDRKHLKVKLEELQKEISRLKDHGKKVEEQQTVLAESQQEITNKRYEIKRLEECVKRSKEELQYEKENVKRLQIDLDKTRLQATKRTNAGQQQQLLNKKDAELAQVKSDGKKTTDQRDSLMLRVKSQGDEIDRLGALVKTKEQELAQERCEVAYLKEVNERLTAALKVREEKVEKTKVSAEGSSPNSKKVDVIELELGRTVEKMQQLQTEKDMESSRLQKKISEKDAEVKRLQGRLRDRGRGSERNGDQKGNPAQRRLEQDRLELQAKLAKREHELKQARHQVAALQTQERNTGPALSNSILQKKEAELKACQEKLHQRHAEITYIRDKLGERDAEMTALKVKLDRVHRQNPENGRRSGSLDRELSGTRVAKQQLESQVKSLHEENARLKDKLSRVAVGVRTLSESHMNLAKLSMVPSVPDKPKFERTDPKVVVQLQKEVASLKQEISRMNTDRDKQTTEFRQEHGIWQEEKHRVIAYQKQLQLNYVQMCQKNKKLEQEVQQLSKELDNEEVIQC